MNCLDPKAKKIPQIIQGEDKTLTVQLSDPDTKEFTNITGVSEITAIFLNTDGSFLQKKLSTSGIVLVNALAGKFQIVLSAAETALLALTPENSYSNIEVRFVIASKTTIVQLEDSIEVVAKLFNV